MRRRRTVALLLLLALAGLIPVARAATEAPNEALSEPPAAPPGFSWRVFDSIQATFLVPDGWFVKAETREGTRAVFITKESIEREGRFKTGLTVNVMRDARPSAYAAAMMSRLQARASQAWAIRPVERGVFKGMAGRLRFTTPEGWSLIEEALMLGNDATGALYFLLFEAPEAEWAAAGSGLFEDMEGVPGSTVHIGQTLFAHLALNPES